MEEVNRRLAGILAADVVGYSAKMGADDADTLARVRTLRSAVIEPLAATHGGRLFKSMGDGFLVEFPSAVQALRCAIAIQSALNAQAEGLRLRIGVHQGEVVAEGDDLFGDGVIVAARLEPLAENGGIVISSRVKEDASGKIPLEVDDLGEPPLKNIAARVRVYRVRTGGTGMAASSAPGSAKPSILVLPFANMSGAPEQEYFADGLTEDILTDLSRFRELFVISRNTSFKFKGQAVDVKKVARELGVQYVVEGSVRKAGNRVRVTVQLIDAESDHHVWAERYDRDLEDIFAIQDEVTSAIVATLPGRMEAAARTRTERKPPANMVSYECVLEAKICTTGEPRRQPAGAESHPARNRTGPTVRSRACVASVHSWPAVWPWLVRRPRGARIGDRAGAASRARAGRERQRRAPYPRGCGSGAQRFRQSHPPPAARSGPESERRSGRGPAGRDHDLAWPRRGRHRMDPQGDAP